MSTAVKGPRFLGTSLLYFMGTVLAKAAVFLLLPLYTAKIPAADLGAMDASVAIAVFAASVLLLDVGVAILRFTLQAEGAEQGKALATGLCLAGALTAVYLALALLAFFLFDIAHFSLIALYGITNVLLLAAGHVTRAVGARLRYVLSGLVAALLQVSLSLILVLGLGMGIRGLYLAYIAGALGGILVALSAPALWRAVRGARPNGKLFLEMLRFALPLGASAAAFLVLSSLARVVVFYHFGGAAAGHFAVALKFSQIILLVSACFQLAWQELALAKSLTAGDARYYTASADLFLRVTLSLLIVIIPLTALLLALFPRFLGAEYAAARALLPAAFCFSVSAVVATFFEPILAKYGKTGDIFLSTLAGALLNVALTALVILLDAGAVWLLAAGAASFLAVALIRILLLRRAGRLYLSPWRYLLLLLPLAATLTVYHLFAPVWQAAVLALAVLLSMAVLMPEILLLLMRERCERK